MGPAGLSESALHDFSSFGVGRPFLSRKGILSNRRPLASQANVIPLDHGPLVYFLEIILIKVLICADKLFK